MTLRLTVDRSAWLRHVQATAAAYGPGLVPVVKGNGYGFGRASLHELAASWAPEVCVGTVHELADVPADLQPVVLTPTLAPPAGRADAILTVGSVAHAQALAGTGARVIVKLASTMRRFGVPPDELPALLGAVADAGLHPVAVALHLPLAGTDTDRLAEIEAWLAHLPADDLPCWVSHLQPASFHALEAAHPHRPFRIRVGTGLWHGTPRGDFLRLGVDVLQTHTVRAGDVVGYHHSAVPFDGTLLCLGAGSAHGVMPLAHDDPARRSPFHFARRRLHLLERPHMHTSLVVVPQGEPVPGVDPATGEAERVDVQQPLINVHPDRIDWQP